MAYVLVDRSAEVIGALGPDAASLSSERVGYL
jgi:hypothetical protein